MDTVRCRIGSGRGTRLQAKDGTRWALMRCEEQHHHAFAGQSTETQAAAATRGALLAGIPGCHPFHCQIISVRGRLVVNRAEPSSAQQIQPSRAPPFCRACGNPRIAVASRQIDWHGMEGCGNPTSILGLIKQALGRKAPHLPGCLAGDGAFRPSQPEINISGSVR
jgi:hypothetical protein